MEKTFSTTNLYPLVSLLGPFAGVSMDLPSFTVNGPLVSNNPAESVDVASTFTINQTNNGIQVYIMAPTDTATTRVFVFANTGTEDLTLTDGGVLTSLTLASHTATVLVYLPGIGYTQLVASAGA